MAIDRSQSQDPAFHALLDWLNPNRDRAADEYVRLHRRLAKMFEARGCLTPEDCADETFNRIGSQLIEGKEIRTDNPTFYINGVARHVLLEQWSKPVQEQIEDLPAEKQPQDNSSRSE